MHKEQTLSMKFFALNLILALLFFGCQELKRGESVLKPTTFDSDNPDSWRPADPATKDMIQRIKSALLEVDPQQLSLYFNKNRAQYFYAKMQNETGPDRMDTEMKHAEELINAGDTEKAVQAYKSMIEKVDKSGGVKKKGRLILLKRKLAVCYLRRGEEDNCLLNHTAESCIIPIAPGGQHKIRGGSEKAIVLLEEVLQSIPYDKPTQYLLNIAYMTLGGYPADVPPEYLISPDYFESSANFPKFVDIAMNVGVADMGLLGGTCIDDFNNDGYLDIIASSWGFNDQIKYFENNKKGGFDDKTKHTGLKGVCGGINLRHADYNNDGHTDFIILRGAWLFGQGNIPNSLIRNNGDGTFTDVTVEAGLFSAYPTQTAEWSDFNLDGWLDLFIANESNDRDPAPCELFVSNRDGTFTNRTVEAGINLFGFFKGVACGDLDNDGYAELYVSALGADNVLLVNTSQGDQVSFRAFSTEVGLSEPQMSFPTWIFDFNNDGFEDIFVSAYGGISAIQLMMEGLDLKSHVFRPLLYKNNGDGTFTEVSEQMGLNEPAMTMGCNYGDLDNDGYLDFYLATGEPNLYSIVPNRMYRNVNGQKYEDVTYTGGFGHIQKGHAVGFGDLDMDGDQDIYAVMGGAFEGDVYQNILYENTLGSKNNWVSILLHGTTSNRSAIGTKISIVIEENGRQRTIYHTVGNGASFGGNSLVAEIGLGQADKILSLNFIWPNRQRSTMTAENLPVNVHLEITEGGNQIINRKLEHIPFSKVEQVNHQH